MENTKAQTQRQDLPAYTAGDPAGPLTIYFHGAPGAPSELAIFEAPARACGLKLMCWDRFALDASLAGPAYFAAQAAAIREVAGANQVNLIGFSIGAFIALRTSQMLGPQVGQLHLVSAAAPLQSGHFLPHMAGRAVFHAASVSPRRFKAAVLGQAAFARWAPGWMQAVLFRGATGVERELTSGSAFRLFMSDLLRSSLLEHRAGYERDILAYVQDWSPVPAQVTADTTLWHGTQDNWAPADMATSLRDKLPNCRRLNLLEGLSHFSCLHQAAPLICHQICTGDSVTATAPAET